MRYSIQCTPVNERDTSLRSQGTERVLALEIPGNQMYQQTEFLIQGIRTSNLTIVLGHNASENFLNQC